MQKKVHEFTSPDKIAGRDAVSQGPSTGVVGAREGESEYKWIYDPSVARGREDRSDGIEAPLSRG